MTDDPLTDAELVQVTGKRPVGHRAVYEGVPTGLPPQWWMDGVWRIFVRASVRMVKQGDLFDLNDPPYSPGVYFLWHDGALRYVGTSGCIAIRLQQHQVAGRIPFNSASWIITPAELAPLVELPFVRGLRPPNNVKMDGAGWAGTQRMTRVVERVWRQFLR